MYTVGDKIEKAKYDETELGDIEIIRVELEEDKVLYTFSLETSRQGAVLVDKEFKFN